MSRPRVVVVDDHALFRAGVVAELGDRVELVATADDIDAAIAVVCETLPDVVLLDVHLPSGTAEAVITACAHLDTVRFLALSVSDAPDDVITLVRAGARGYVTK
ncbi:MAG: response regulator transcription factor, partial [Microthrixaceae bacterium]|nr:response regulator transcription factor [Microthrixaceae bacterium]